MHTPLSRRTALKASGIAVALPLLKSMNAAIGKEVATSPKRMVLICNTLGLHPPSLFPETVGGDYESTEYLDLLKDHREDFTLFSGLSHPDQNGKQPHDTEMTWLSAARNPGLAGFKNSVLLTSMPQRSWETPRVSHRFRSAAIRQKASRTQATA